MSNQPEENQDPNFTPEQPNTPPLAQDTPPTQHTDASSADVDANTPPPPTQYGTPPPPSYDQPAFYQQPEYNTPPPNTPNQPPYGADVPYSESAPPPSYNAGTSPYEQNVPPSYGQPPYGYAQAPYGYTAAPIPPAQPLPLGEAIRQLPAQYWRVLTHPSARTFAYEQGKAAWNIIWVQLIALAIISAIFSALVALETTALSGALSNTSSSTMLAALTANPLIAGVYSLIAVPVGFFIGTGIYFLLAKAFRGQGKFLPFAYCYLLIIAPINIIGDVLRLIPILGSFIAGALGIYGIVLLVFMTMAVQRLSGGKATLVILIPLIVLFVLVIILVIVIVSIAVSSIPR